MSTQPYGLYTQVGVYYIPSWPDGCCSSAASLATQSTNLSTIKFPSVGICLRPCKKGCEQHTAVQQALLNQLGLTHSWLMRGAGHDCKLIFSSGYPCTQVSVLIKLTSAQLMLMDSTATYACSSVTQLRKALDSS